MKTTLRLGSQGEEVKEWQNILDVVVDGQFGPKTLAATLAWQERHHLTADGIVGPFTWKVAESFYSLAAVRGIERLNQSDLEAVVQAAKAIGTQPDYLLSVISFETAGTFNSAEPNRAGSGAVGLIQFMPRTAEMLGTTTEDLAAMSFQEQLVFVVRYFQSFKRTFSTLRELYLAVFWPAASSKDDDYVIARKGTKVYEQNIGFDRKGKGYITRNDVCSVIDNVLAQAEKRSRVAVV